jgi:2,5-diketo-D-gluconate reductase A
MTAEVAPTVKMNNGLSIPQVGWGIMTIPSEEMVERLAEATAAGYRLIDTAQAYGNERGLGRAIAASDIPRDDLFITTKLANAEQGYDKTMRAFDASMERLGLSELDLFLIHWPSPEFDLYVETWKAFEELLGSGRVRSIGVSNFTEEHLTRLFESSGVVPVLNQVELHPRFPQEELRQFHAQHGILTEAWSPLEGGGRLQTRAGLTDRPALLEEPVLLDLSKLKDKTPAQIVLRWHIQLGNVIIPKSSSTHRMKENISLFDFDLTDDEMGEVATLNIGRLGPDPAVTNVAFEAKDS